MAAFADNDYGKRIRRQFADIRGSSELAMLQSPTGAELEQLRKAVAIMTPGEKSAAGDLTDKQIQKIAADAEIDAALFAIFINGYALNCRQSQ
ncbi:MAG: hypothetical protein DRP65_02150 [Planctomycetota bacterium]|nr:MAG: hypothetical protein DRP65_02150 [Planctomycetota bacterium]